MRSKSRSRRWSAILCGLILMAHQACVSTRPWRTQEVPWNPRELEKAEQVRVRTTGGDLVSLVRVSVGEDSRGAFLRGTAVDARGKALREVVLHEEQIVWVQTRRLEGRRVAANAGIWIGVAAGAVLVALIGALSALGSPECDTADILDSGRVGRSPAIPGRPPGALAWPRPKEREDAPCESPGNEKGAKWMS